MLLLLKITVYRHFSHAPAHFLIFYILEDKADMR